MKKYLIFMLLALISIGASAVNVDLSVASPVDVPGSNNWKYSTVTSDLSDLQVNDYIVVSFSESEKGNQYAVKYADGKGAYLHWTEDNEQRDYHTCEAGERNFSFQITDDILKTIKSKGLRIENNGLSNISVMRARMTENWTDFKPNDMQASFMDAPQYIKDWYSGAYSLQTDLSGYYGYTLRVVCLETADDSYGFLKKGTGGWPSLMSGSDKFSIAGWKYFDVKINQSLIDNAKGSGLIIGGNNYFIAGIYVCGSKDGSIDQYWNDGDVVDSKDITIDGSNGWSYGDINGEFFEYKGDIAANTKIANTKNNIIRLVFEPNSSVSTHQVSANDKDGNKNAGTYIRKRQEYKNADGSGTNRFYYVNYADCESEDINNKHYDFELSDAITVFDVDHETNGQADGYKTPIQGEEGVKKGMLSTLLQNGMHFGANGVKIIQVQIRHSQASKYISGKAVYVHPLSTQYWRTISLPYNLTQDQLRKAFGDDVMICDLGASTVTKTYVGKDNTTYTYGITLNFDLIQGDLNANYPYIIKLGSSATNKGFDKDDRGYTGPYVFEDVKADVRDFQAYEFRTPEFKYADTFIKQEGQQLSDEDQKLYDFEQQIKSDLNGVYMIFQSTAPVFSIKNESEGKVEIIDGTNLMTTINTPQGENHDYVNYLFFDNKLYPVLKKNHNLSSGLAYIKFPKQTYNFINGKDAPQGVSVSSKYAMFFPDDNVTGIEDVATQPMKQNSMCVYNLGGQLVRKGISTEGLAKGIYIVNGKKVIVK